MINKAATELRGTVLQNTAPPPEKGYPLAAPHTGHMGRLDSAFQLADGTPWSRLLGTCGDSQCHVPITPNTALSPLCIGTGATAAGHCEQLEAACIVRAVSAATSSRDTLFDLHFLHPF